MGGGGGVGGGVSTTLPIVWADILASLTCPLTTHSSLLLVGFLGCSLARIVLAKQARHTQTDCLSPPRKPLLPRAVYSTKTTNWSMVDCGIVLYNTWINRTLYSIQCLMDCSSKVLFAKFCVGISFNLNKTQSD